MPVEPPQALLRFAQARAQEAREVHQIATDLVLECTIVADDMGDCPRAFIFVFGIGGDAERRLVVGPCGIGSDGTPVNVGSCELRRFDPKHRAEVDRLLQVARYYAWYQAVGGDLNETVYGDVDALMPRLEELASRRNVTLSRDQLEAIEHRLRELAASARYDPRTMTTIDDPLDYFREVFLSVLAGNSVQLSPR